MNSENQENVMTIAEDFVESSGEMLCCNSSEACGSCCNPECNSGNEGWSENSCSCGGSCEECCGNCGNGSNSSSGSNDNKADQLMITYDMRPCSELLLEKGQDSALLATRLFPYGCEKECIRWTVSRGGVVRLESYVQYGTSFCRVHAIAKGTVTVKAKTWDGRLVDTCEVTVDQRDRVEIEDQGEYFTVTFVDKVSTDGKVWRSVCCDVEEKYHGMNIWETEDALLDDIARNVKYNDGQNYTFDQLALLYRLDPLGVVFYVKCRSNQMDTAEGLFYKDAVYRAIFEVKAGEFYFVPTNDGLPNYGYYGDSARENVFSVAEFLFGKHSIPEFDLVDFITACLDGFFTLTSPAYAAIKSVWGGVKTCQALFASSSLERVVSSNALGLVEAYRKEMEQAKIYNAITETQKMKRKKQLDGIENTFKIVGVALDVMNAGIDAIEIITLPDLTIYKSFKNLNYRLILKGQNQNLSIEEMIEWIETNQSR